MWGRDVGVRIHGQATPQDPRPFQKAKPAGLHSAPLGPGFLAWSPQRPILGVGAASAFPGLTLPRPKLAIICFGVETPCLERSLLLPVAYIWVSSSVITPVHSWPEPSALSRPRTHQIGDLVQKRFGTFSAESSPSAWSPPFEPPSRWPRRRARG